MTKYSANMFKTNTSAKATSPYYNPRRIKKTETIDKSLLKKIIVNLYDVIKDNDISLDDNDEKLLVHGIDPLDGLDAMLRKYYKRLQGNRIDIEYNQKNDSIGRLFVKGGIGLQSMKRCFRNTISHKFYNDIDMVNAHPVILLYICKKNNLKAPQLEKYINDREKVLADTGLERTEAKKYYLTIINDTSITYKNSTKHMIAFKKELEYIHKSLCTLFNKQFKERRDINVAKKKLNNHSGSFVNHMMCEIENKILMCMMKYFGDPDDCVLCFDGIMVRKEIKVNIKKCQKHIKKVIGIDMKLAVKKMGEILDLSKYAKVSDKDVELIDTRVYRKYKPKPEFHFNPSVTFNREYVSKSLKKSYFNKITTNIVLKSDTGTGKTSSFASHMKKTKEKFISIGSRISLSHSQYKSFKKAGLDCVYYRDRLANFFNDDNVVIMLDSIRRIENLDFSDYVVYLDEFAFLVQYLLTSSTLNNKRVECFRLFVKLIKECKRFICTDADIDKVCLRFLDLIDVQYVKHLNEHNKCQNIVATELPDRDCLVKKLKKLDKYVACVDSKTEAESLFKSLGSPKDIVVYTSDFKGSIDMDNNNKIIMSPKVITGVDSLMARPVFAIYKEMTISSKHMMQQINRCRNIEYINYVFPLKDVSCPAYKNLEEAKSYVKFIEELCDFKRSASDHETILYSELFSMTIYDNDCDNTNKFKHFKNILKARGVVDSDNVIIRKQAKRLATRREMLNEKLDKIELKDLMVCCDADEKLVHGEYAAIANKLEIPIKKRLFYKDILVDEILRRKHYNYCSFFVKDDLKKRLNLNKDFNVNKNVSINAQLDLLKTICNKFGIKDLSGGKVLTITKKPKRKIKNELADQYMGTFRYQGRKKIKFTDNKDVLKIVAGSFKNLFGSDVLKSKRVRKGDERDYQYTLSKPFFKYHKKLFKYRDIHKVIKRKLV